MIKKLNIGDFAKIKKSFSQEEVSLYNKLINDTNPVHYDSVYCKKTSFKKPIVPGLLVSSLFGGLLGSRLPGKGTIYLGQELKFKNPVYIQEMVESKIEVIHTRNDKPIIKFRTSCTKENGDIAVEGEAVVFYKGEIFK